MLLLPDEEFDALGPQRSDPPALVGTDHSHRPGTTQFDHPPSLAAAPAWWAVAVCRINDGPVTILVEP